MRRYVFKIGPSSQNDLIAEQMVDQLLLGTARTLVQRYPPAPSRRAVNQLEVPRGAVTCLAPRSGAGTPPSLSSGERGEGRGRGQSPQASAGVTSRRSPFSSTMSPALRAISFMLSGQPTRPRIVPADDCQQKPVGGPSCGIPA